MLLGNINLTVSDKKIMFSEQKTIHWCYHLEKDTIIRESTLGTFRNNYIEIHPPREGILAFTQFTPFPRVIGPLDETEGFSSEISTKLLSGWDTLNGETIRKKLTMTGIDTCMVLGSPSNCYTSEGSNLSHTKVLGLYSCKFWFNREYGFVKMKYRKPDGAVFQLILTAINEKE